MRKTKDTDNLSINVIIDNFFVDKVMVTFKVLNWSNLQIKSFRVTRTIQIARPLDKQYFW
jgi:hypothetical protein